MKQDKKRQEVSTKALTLVALGITMNMVGGFIALQFLFSLLMVSFYDVFSNKIL